PTAGKNPRPHHPGLAALLGSRLAAAKLLLVVENDICRPALMPLAGRQLTRSQDQPRRRLLRPAGKCVATRSPGRVPNQPYSTRPNLSALPLAPLRFCLAR